MEKLILAELLKLNNKLDKLETKIDNIEKRLQQVFF